MNDNKGKIKFIAVTYLAPKRQKTNKPVRPSHRLRFKVIVRKILRENTCRVQNF